MSKAVTRDLICEELGDSPLVTISGTKVTLDFDTEEMAEKAFFVLKNALELQLGVQFRPGRKP